MIYSEWFEVHSTSAFGPRPAPLRGALHGGFAKLEQRGFFCSKSRNDTAANIMGQLSNKTKNWGYKLDTGNRTKL